MILGIDEAGRGPVLGPLVMCGVRATRRDVERLERLGVKDSKAYGSGCQARAAREELASEIRRLAQVDVMTAPPQQVDQWTVGGGLNRLEQTLAEQLISSHAHPPLSQIVADGERLFSPLRARYAQLEALDRAEQSHAIVAAASIVAKVERDRLLAELLAPYQPEFGPIGGGGYCNRGTAAFLRAHAARYRCLPRGVRRSWGWRVLVELCAQLGEA